MNTYTDPDWSICNEGSAGLVEIVGRQASISKDRGQRPAFQFFVKWNDRSDRAFRMFEANMADVLADRFPPERAEHSNETSTRRDGKVRTHAGIRTASDDRNEPTSAEGCWW